MPNHVDNDLIVKGNMDRIQAFMSFAKSMDGDREIMLDVNNFIPYPEEYKKLDVLAEQERQKGNYAVKDGYNQGGYQWCIKNWGTKWGIYNCSVTKKFKESIWFNFQTAWSPALPVINKMSEQFPELLFTLKYYERGCAFQGVYQVKAGEVLKESTGDYRGSRGG